MNARAVREDDADLDVLEPARTDAAPWDAPGASVATVFKHYAPDVSSGLHRNLRRLITGLWGASSGGPRARLLADLAIEVQWGMVVAGPIGDDAVVLGFLRRFTVQARFTCHLCGRPGVVRSSLGLRALCPKCAAPLLLRTDLALMLDGSPVLAKEDRAIRIAEVPLTLRSLFREKALECSRHLEPAGAVMGARTFIKWGRRLETLRRDAPAGQEAQ